MSVELPKGRPVCSAKPPCTFKVVPLEDIEVQWDGAAVNRKAVAFPDRKLICLEQRYWDSLRSAQAREAILAHERGHLEGARCEPCADFRAGEILRREGAPNVRDAARGLFGGLDNRDAVAAAGALVAGFGLDDGFLHERQRADGVKPELVAFMDVLAREGIEVDGSTYHVEVQENGGVRTTATQLMLYRKGRTWDPTKGPVEDPKAWVVTDAKAVVTNAWGLNGPHPKGKAVDFFVRTQAGVAIVYPSQVGSALFERLYTALGDKAKAHGLKWGGDFTLANGQRDWGHVEIGAAGSIAAAVLALLAVLFFEVFK